MNHRIEQIDDEQDEQQHQKIDGHLSIPVTSSSFALPADDAFGKADQRRAEREKSNQQRQHQQAEPHTRILLLYPRLDVARSH
jgi:hypothetical protein